MTKTKQQLFITAVDYEDAPNKRISIVELLVPDNRNKELLTRDEVIQLLNEGSQLSTIAVRDESRRPVCATVRTFTRKGEQFITTEQNDTEFDNLGKLPRIIY